LSEIVRLAVRDMAREPVHVLCIVGLIAGVVAPLMLLLSVKTGVMEALIGALRDDPNMRRIAVVGNHDFGDAELERLRSWPEVAFAGPEERSIARRLDVRAPGARAFERMTLVSSGPGDPLSPADLALEPGQIAVSASLANRFSLSPGARLEARATRGDPPTARLNASLEVVHVLPRGWLQGNAALAPFAFVSAVEAFFDDYAVPEYGVEQGADRADRRIRYESFRVFAHDLRDVAPLEARFERSLGVQVASRVDEIGPILELDRLVARALDILALIAAAGLAAALTALFWSSVERKRLTLSMLALMGTPPRELALFPLVQAALFAFGGGLAATAVFLVGVGTFEAMFAGQLGHADARVAPVRPLMLAAVQLALLVLAVAAAGVAARRAFAVEPATVIRTGG